MRRASKSRGIGRRQRALALTVIALVFVAAVGAAVVVETPYRADGDRLSEAESADGVTVDTGSPVVVNGGPVTDDTVGVVLYPGALVEPESYAWTVAPLVAERDVVVVIPRMPLNLALFNPDAAADVRGEYDEIDRWVVGGHSLGGAMACRHAASNPDRVDGLVLLGAYCDGGDDLRGTGLTALSTLGGADGVISAETERERRVLLGERAVFERIDGMNHAQFGAYGDQRGDDESEIDDETARDRLLTIVGNWLQTELAVTERGETVPTRE